VWSGARGINAFGPKISADMQIARLSLSGVNEKMRFAAHTVWGNLRPTDSSHLHCLDVAFGPPAIAKASVRKSAQKQNR
jgi:hypothetical protein